MKYAIYDNDGRILSMVTDAVTSASTPEMQAASLADAYLDADDDMSVLAVAANVQDDTHFIKLSTGKANLRDMTPATPDATTVAADGTSPITLSYLRPNTHIQVTGPINGEITVTDGGSDTLTFALPGQYTLTATAPFPAKPREIVLHAT